MSLPLPTVTSVERQTLPAVAVAREWELPPRPVPSRPSAAPILQASMALPSVPLLVQAARQLRRVARSLRPE